jgi:hypothetical protein
MLHGCGKAVADPAQQLLLLFVRDLNCHLVEQRLTTVADAVPRNGTVIVPAKEWEIQDKVREAGCLVAIFATDSNVTRRDRKVARAVALVVNDRIMIDYRGERSDHGALRDDVSAVAQVAGALAAFTLTQMQPQASSPPVGATA